MEITEEDIKNGFRYKSHQKFEEICHNIEGERYTSKYGVGPNGGDYCILTNDEKMQLLKMNI